MERKTKFSIKFKEALIREYHQGSSSSRELAVKHGISSRYLRRLVQRFEETGCVGQPKGNNIYGRDFKLGCVISVVENGLSLSEATSRFGIPNDSTLVEWIKLYRVFGENGLETTKVGRPKAMTVPKKKTKRAVDPDVAALQEELEYLRAENAYLKKLGALIQEELKVNGPKPKRSKN